MAWLRTNISQKTIDFRQPLTTLACHSVRSEESVVPKGKILRFAQDDG